MKHIQPDLVIEKNTEPIIMTPIDKGVYFCIH